MSPPVWPTARIVQLSDRSIARDLHVGDAMPLGWGFARAHMGEGWPFLCGQDHLMPPRGDCITCGFSWGDDGKHSPG